MTQVKADDPHAGSEDAFTLRARSRVGQVLRGKWRLERLLGVGGMACVYEATHRNGKRGAVKMLHLELSLDSEAQTRFLREGYVANKVDHPGAVSVLDDDTAEDGAVFLVMELLDGETVDARARSRPGHRLEIGEVVVLTERLLDVLASAHDKGIVHRDLKPENLFLTKRGELKVLDFGIARLRELSTASTATRTGSVMGTPAFMPPEQALGNWSSVDARTDIWAVGATMFCLLTGRQVHEADTVNKLLLAAMTKPAPRIQTIVPAIPPRLAAIVDCALAFEQHERWPDARTMQQALRDLQGAVAGAEALVALAPHPPTMGSPRVEGAAIASSAVGGASWPNAGGPSLVTASPLSRDRTLAASAPRSKHLAVGAGVVLLFAIAAVAIVVTAPRGKGDPAPATGDVASARSEVAPSPEADATQAAPTATVAPSAVPPAPDTAAAASNDARVRPLPPSLPAGAKRGGSVSPPTTAGRPATPSARPKDPLDNF